MQTSASLAAVRASGAGPQATAADTKSQQVKRDVRERGRDIEGCIKQWLNFVKPNFSIYVRPQRDLAGN